MMIIVIYGDQYNHLCFDEDHTEIYIEMVMIIFMIKVDNEDEKDEQSLTGGGLECDWGYFLSLTLREMHLRDCDEECVIVMMMTMVRRMMKMMIDKINLFPHFSQASHSSPRRS